MKLDSYTERAYWNKHSYGEAYIIPRKALIASATVICVLTPFTNWLIPLLPGLVRNDLRWNL